MRGSGLWQYEVGVPIVQSMVERIVEPSVQVSSGAAVMDATGAVVEVIEAIGTVAIVVARGVAAALANGPAA